MLNVNICAYAGYPLIPYICKTPKIDGHTKVRWFVLKSDRNVSIRTSKSVSGGVTPSVMSCHNDDMGNVELAIQNQQDRSDRLSKRSIHDTF